MNDLIKTVLLANSSQLGFNWMYNRKFLKEHSKNNEMLMTLPNHAYYREYKPSYFSYPNAKIGDVTLQGEILKWLYNGWKKSSNYSVNDYKRLLVKHLMPGGLYNGYVESYGNKLILNELNKKFNLKEVSMDDDQLVGFVPYIVSKALNEPVDKALSLAHLLTNNKDYDYYFNALDLILEKGKTSLDDAITLMPVNHQTKIKEAINATSVDDFVNSPHDLSCSIEVAMPIIFYLYNKHQNLLEALKENVVIGGASSDRALILAILYFPSELPKEWYGYIQQY